MFAPKKAPDAATALIKFQDPKRDSLRRLRALHTAHSLLPASKRKAIFNDNFSLIYFLFHDAFTNLEATLKVKGNRVKPLTDAQQAELLDIILPMLELILIYVPEQVGKRWQANSISLIIRKLLHPENQMTLRKKAVQLLLLWIQDLQKNCSKDIFHLFVSVVPAVMTGRDDQDMQSTGNREKHPQSVFHVPLEDHNLVSMPELIPILPATDMRTDTSAKELLVCILDGLTLEFQRIQWEKTEQRLRGFVYLFEQFKRFYIKPLFPVDNLTPHLYQESESGVSIPAQASLPSHRFTSLQQSLRNIIVRWLLDLIKPRKRKSPSPQSSTSSTDGADLPSAAAGTPVNAGDTKKSITHHLSIDVSGLTAEERRSHGVKLLRFVLMSLKDNIELIHNVCHQGFQLPFTYLNTVRNLVFLYLEWIKEPNLRPVFMREPDPFTSVSPLSGLMTSSVSSSQLRTPLQGQLTAVPEEDGDELTSVASLSSSALTRDLREHEPSPFEPTPISGQTPEATSELSQLDTIMQGLRAEKMTEDHNDENREPSPQENDSDLELGSPVRKMGWREDVRVGLQPNLRLFVTNVACVFMAKPPTEFLDHQVELCTHGLNLFQTLARKPQLHRYTWEHLLATLLDVTLTVLRSHDPQSKKHSLGSRILSEILKTLFVSWIRANLMVPVSATLWDDLLQVLSSQTRWPQVIQEWARTMVILTRLLAKHVYSLDVSQLPLDTSKSTKRRDMFESKLRQSKADDTKAHRDSFISGLANVPSSIGKQSSLASQTPFSLSQPQPIRSRTRSEVVLPGPRIAMGNDRLKSARDKAIRKKKGESGTKTETRPRCGSDSDLLPGLQQPDEEEEEVKSTPASLDMTDSPQSRLVSLRRSQTISGADSSPRLRLSPGRTIFGSSTDKDSGAKHRRLISLAGDESTMNAVIAMNRTDGPEEEKPKRTKESPKLGLTGPSRTIDIGEVNLEHSLMTKRKDSGRAKSAGMENKNQSISEIKQVMLLTSIEDVSLTTSRETPSLQDGDGEAEDESVSSSVITLESVPVSVESSPEMAIKRAHEKEKSVVAGGKKIGWSDVAAAVLWRQMLGILGNVNDIEDPRIHKEAMECLDNVWDALYKLRQNQGIMSEDGTAGKDPVYSPPLFALSATVFQAAAMPEQFKGGRVIAYQLMCSMFVRRHDHLPSLDLLDHFYRLMHIGLTALDQDFLDAILPQSKTIFSLSLPGAAILIPDFIKGADRVLSSPQLHKEATRVSALVTLGSLLFFNRLYTGMFIDGTVTHEGQPLTFGDVEDQVVALIMRTTRAEESVRGRSFALSQLGMYLFSEFAHGSSRCLDDGVIILLRSLNLAEKAVALVAVDMMHLLSKTVNTMLKHQSHLPRLIVEVMAYSIATLSSEIPTKLGKQVLVGLLTCLLDWTMLLPKQFVNAPSQAQPKKSLRAVVVEIYSTVATGALVDEKVTDYLTSLLTSQPSSSDSPTIEFRALRQGSNESPSAPRSAPPVGGPTEAFPFSTPSPSGSKGGVVVQLTAKACFSHLTSLHSHYPFGCGSSQISGLISERDDGQICAAQMDADVGPALFQSPNVQFFSYKKSSLISVLELPIEETNKTLCRVLIRDTTGKFVWDAKILHGSRDLVIPYAGVTGRLQEQPASLDRRLYPKSSSLSQPSVDPFIVPTYQTAASPETDMLDRLLVHLGATSPECISVPELALNEPPPPPDSFLESLQNQTIDLLHSQDSTERLAVLSSLDDYKAKAREAEPPLHCDPKSPFYHCLLLLSSIGYLTWEQRDKLDLLKKEDQLLRELKHLDSRQCRETHKIAVFYVARGQEDKFSIMANSEGSKDFEDFVSGLGWEVDLSSHAGFMGGLKPNTVSTTPYYSTSTTEVLFHVATRFPTNVVMGTQWWTNKLRHLGNDEIQIVWSEHTRDYRSDIIKTEFGDVYIIIYPLPNRLFRIQIIKKPDVPFFGPLFDGAVVDKLTLPCLVRETALNASRAKRSRLPFYEKYFEERAKYIENTIRRLKRPTTFEEFATRSVLPAALRSDRESMPRLLVTDTERPLSTFAGDTGTGDDVMDGRNRPRASTIASSDAERISPKTRLRLFDDQNKPADYRSSFPEGLNQLPKNWRQRHNSDRHGKT
eukprot:m.309686 g.309686  ORF g.309686 m.309686 type:complete len:2118 (+) comp47370_c0_seq1:63-6416(+)